MIYPSLSMQVDVAAGATTRTTVGGTGRPIIGKLTAPAEVAGQVDWIQSQNSLIVKPTAGRRALRGDARS